ncbi:LysE family translocator [Paracoccus tibetensis]|uniref:Threonine/homoserine/homoserine lactone efflux protein n=1 Tax=Paracoccus tibetensis TaxID=336292 RepID=A0A1G5B7T3_9RHOB|nr:LysE family transporter [Paracoccus tibetensis]SCX86223.1 Threonine/homoserine/homoserine lactone efflux protein [Paracoccus tibetensis]
MQLLTYALALGLVAAAPGPVVAILMARALSGHRRGAACFAGGVILGKLATLAAVTSGLVLWLGLPGAPLLAAKIIFVGYLVTVVLQMWNTAPIPVTAERHPRRSASEAGDVAAGFAAGVASPLSLLFFVTLLPAGLHGGNGGWPTILGAAAVTAVAPGLVFGAYILLACRLQRLLRRPRHVRLVHRAMAVLIGGTTAVLLLDPFWKGA